MWIDPTDPAVYRPSIFNGYVSPRPIGWVSTQSREGVCNLAPFSYYNAISSRPPLVMFACGAPSDRREKDTLRNVRETSEFVVNLACWDLREQMNLSSTDVEYGVDEFDLAGVTKAASRHVAPPRVAESPIGIECRAFEIVDVPPQREMDQAVSVVLGRVVMIHARDEFIDATGRLDISLVKPLVRLGGLQYAAVEHTFELMRKFKSQEPSTSLAG